MTNTKQCSKCKEVKPVTEFTKDKNRKDGLFPWCKSCQKQQYEANKEKILERRKQHYEANKEEILERKKQHYEANKEKIAERNKRHLMDNPAIRLKHNMAGHMRHIGRAEAFKHLPYTSKELKEHIETLWEPWMNWDNYGPISKNKRTWQVDHIIPRNHFIYDSPHHPNFQKCWALSNLRPICAWENLKKRDKLLTEES